MASKDTNSTIFTLACVGAGFVLLLWYTKNHGGGNNGQTALPGDGYSYAAGYTPGVPPPLPSAIGNFLSNFANGVGGAVQGNTEVWGGANNGISLDSLQGEDDSFGSGSASDYTGGNAEPDSDYAPFSVFGLSGDQEPGAIANDDYYLGDYASNPFPTSDYGPFADYGQDSY